MSIAARRLMRAPAVTSDRPTGPGYVRYEDLYQPGDSVGAALNRLATPAIVTFPEGVFLLNGFQYYGGAIDCKKTMVRGIIGSGSGILFDESRGTIFKMVPNSSSFVKGTSPETPTQAQGGTTQVWVIRCVGAEGDVRFENFQIVGTEQGHNYNGLYAYHVQGSTTIKNVKVSGVAGDNGAPPGETFGISAYQGNMGTTVIENCEVDGRRSGAAGSPWYSAAGITSGQSIGATIRGCHSHHNGAAAFVFYRAFDGVFENNICGTTDPAAHATTNLRGWGVNQEETAGIVHKNCTYRHGAVNQGVHISHSNTNRSFQYTGWPSRSVVDGSLKVVNPTFTDIWGNNYFYIQSWLTGVDGTSNNDSMVTPPLVTLADGVTHLPYKWAHGPTQTVT